MTLLYRPVTIESAEQAEALTEGTFAVRWDTPWIAQMIVQEGEGDWQSKNGSYTHAEMIRCTALVLIEAEEETNTRWDEGDPVNTFTRKRRLVTSWQKADQ